MVDEVDLALCIRECDHRELDDGIGMNILLFYQSKHGLYAQVLTVNTNLGEVP